MSVTLSCAGKGQIPVKIFGLTLEASCGHAMGAGPLLVLSGVVAAPGEGGWNSPSILRPFLAEKQGKGIKETPSSLAPNLVPSTPPSTAESQ